MSQRPGLLVTVRDPSPKPPWPHPDLPDPRSQVPEITVEIRAHWPGWATPLAVGDALMRAYIQAMKEVMTR